jgi:2-succinyl-5-enolpyruvyl-6-hydroxy-3-cyclohexene-1-carboxylate synthase
VNALWASVAAETLFRSGVTTAVISPGSRSTPLTFALARHPGIEAIPVLDERSAAFMALGIAKREMRPVVLLCTSGTAGANYFPAVIEAHEAGVPLLVITADRPPEMRDAASGQTIDQRGLFGAFVSFQHELAVPQLDAGLLRYLRQTLAHAVARTLFPWYGPVHLNAPFRDPLVPQEDGGAADALGSAVDWDSFFTHVVPPSRVEVRSDLPPIPHTTRGLIVAGPVPAAEPSGYAAGVAEIARKLGWPVLADGLSPVRGAASLIPTLVTRYDAILRTPANAESLAPEVVLCLGEWPTSKVLRGWLEGAAPEIFFATERPDNRDALHGRTRRIMASVRTLASALPAAEHPNGYQRQWAAHEARARVALDTVLAAEEGVVEPKAAWLLGRSLPHGTLVSVASSMPVRDMEFVWPANDREFRIFFNRGANGIDGTLSTALGVAHGGAPAVLLTGDLALLHDSNGFLSAGRLRGSLTIVLINNRGGGIFEHLPVARHEEVFEEYFATPQAADFRKLCEAHGVSHTHVEDWEHFESLIAALPPSGVRVLEITTDRKRDAAWRKDTFASVGRPS